MTLIVKYIRSLDDLEIHADAWDKLAARMPHELPVVTHAWIATFLEHRLVPGEKWCCLIAYEDLELVGVLPLIITPHKVLGFTRKLLRSPSDNHTRSVSVLVVPGKEEKVIDTFLSSLSMVDPKWHSVYLERISTSSPIIKYLNHNSKFVLNFQEFCGVGSYLSTTGSFEEFRSCLKSKFRTNLATRTKRLNGYQNVSTEFLNGEKATEADLERFINIEVLGWKGRVGSAIVQSPELVEFYTSLVKRLSKQGWLEWHFLLADGKTIAGNFVVRCGPTMVICKLGYDEEYSKCSPGTLLFEQEVKYAFESEMINQIDLISDPPYAKNWQMQKQDYNNLWIYPSSFLPFIADIIPRRIRNRLKDISFLRKVVQRFNSMKNKSKP